MKKYDIPYNDRELSWIDFNFRVLDEALNKDNPIMERLKFLSITSSNLDEFFMVRVAKAMNKPKSNINAKSVSGLIPIEKLCKLNKKLNLFVKSQYECLETSIIPDLEKYGIEFLSINKLNKEQKKYVDEYFKRVIFTSVTPFIIENSKAFPLLPNKNLNIASIITTKNYKHNIAIIQIPNDLKRFLEVPSDKGRRYVMLEDIILYKLPLLFNKAKVQSSCVFRITRNANFDIINDDEDYLSCVEKSIRKRKRSNPVRLEISGANCKEIKNALIEILNINKYQVYKVPKFIDLTFLSKFVKQNGFENYFFKPIVPINPPVAFRSYDNIFQAIRKKDRLIYHPFESFDVVLKFIDAAAEDKNVTSIKQTLYRVSEHSPIIDSLIKARKNGKDVTVLVELKARFDEENNIIWAKKLENAGCKVIYGPIELKTHCKVVVVSRCEKGVIKNYVHMGTGNYHDITAKLYTDMGMFTYNNDFGEDALELFNELGGKSKNYKYKKMILAPKVLRKFFINMIDNEIKNAKRGLKSGITVKINSLVDPKIISKLYEASKAGVKIELIVRGICCLIPGIDGVSENITVTSIVGQLLEHSRIFKFENAGSPRIYIGSADWMQRNLDDRVELVFPIEDPDLKNRISYILEILLNDTVNAKIQLPDTTYVRKKGKRILNSQRELSNIFSRNSNFTKIKNK